MRNLSPTLTAAQKKSSARPYPMVEVYQSIAGIARPTWSKLYDGSQHDGPQAAAISPAGPYMYRLRADAADNVYFQRIVGPGPSSPWAAWDDWAVAAKALAIAAPTTGVTVFAFRIGSDGHLYRRESANYGNTWGSWVDMATIGAAPANYRVAACFKSATSAIVIYSNGTDLYRSRWDSVTGWEASAKWSKTMHSISGVAVSHLGDWDIVVTGTETTTTRPGVWTCLLGDGYSAAPNTWTTLKELTSAPPASGFSYKYPSLNAATVPRAVFVEAYSAPEPYSRLYLTHSLATADFIDNLWREPVPFNQLTDYGAALCYNSLSLWLTTAAKAWRGAIMPDHVDVTSDVTLIQAEARPGAGRIAVALRNDDGRFATIGATGDPYEPIKLGSEIRFSPGYVTTNGNEVSSGPAYWITGWEYLSIGGHAALTLIAEDGWALLQRWRPTRTIEWAANTKNIFQILSFIIARAGLELASVSSSPQITSHKPAFTIHPGESGRAAVLRLLSLMPDVLFFRGNYAYLKNPLAADPPDYSYELPATSSQHPLHQANYTTRVLDANRAQVLGPSVMTEDLDWPQVELVFDELEQVSDVNLTTTTKAHERGAAILRRAALAASSGTILVPLNCGQELYDVVAITDPRAGLAAAKRRVLGLVHTYAPAKARYDLAIELGGA